jgi:hypothetical protein
LERLIELAGSSDFNAKQFSSQNIPEFFATSPDLEENALNAVYDLCEDPSADVSKSLQPEKQIVLIKRNV